jgi:hypothetical protein
MSFLVVCQSMNEEFFKIVISTLSSFFIAFAAEPVKTWSNHQHRKKLTKTAIYREIIFIYDRLIFFDQMSSQGKLFSVGASQSCKTHLEK